MIRPVENVSRVHVGIFKEGNVVPPMYRYVYTFEYTIFMYNIY